jgi:elongation factor 1-gamma
VQKKPAAAATTKKEAPKKEAAPAPAAAKKPTIRQVFSALPKAEYGSLAPFKATYCNEDWDPMSKDAFAKDILPAVERNEYTLWISSYKYPKDQQKLFMSSNMIGGLFQRLEQGRDYALGSMLIFGEENSEAGLEIIGAFIIRGTELPEFIADGPDAMVYGWRKIDTKNAEDMQFFQDLLAWEGKFGGRKYTDAGKIFK